MSHHEHRFQPLRLGTGVAADCAPTTREGSPVRRHASEHYPTLIAWMMSETTSKPVDTPLVRLPRLAGYVN
jgi:hypothetical protein